MALGRVGALLNTVETVALVATGEAKSGVHGRAEPLGADGGRVRLSGEDSQRGQGAKVPG